MDFAIRRSASRNHLPEKDLRPAQAEIARRAGPCAVAIFIFCEVSGGVARVKPRTFSDLTTSTDFQSGYSCLKSLRIDLTAKQKNLSHPRQQLVRLSRSPRAGDHHG